MGISCIASDASATCKFKAKKDIIVILDVGHTDKDSGQISAHGVKEYDFNMNLARLVLEELVNTGFLSTQMIVISGSNTHESRLKRSKRANDLDVDLFISIHHDGVNNETRIPWRYNGKEHWFLDKFEGFSLWGSKKNNPKSGSSGGPNSAIALSALEYLQNSSIAEQFNEMTNSHYFSNVCSDNSRI